VKEYLVYLPTGGEVSVDLAAAAGEFQVEWIHPIEGRAVAAATVSGGERTVLKPPQPELAVLHLWKH
jgi:hypothetical protein